jgi:hypothetical protein
MSNTNNSKATGYKQPPMHHQFRPGQSGNPSGRPKGTHNFKSDLRDELGEIISFHEDGCEVSISKQRALIKRLVTSAARELVFAGPRSDQWQRELLPPALTGPTSSRCVRKGFIWRKALCLRHPRRRRDSRRPLGREMTLMIR